MSYIKVEDEKTLVRDTLTGAILNTDLVALAAYKKRMSGIKAQEDRIIQLEQTVQELKTLINNMVNR